jgi:hypothetical protein
MIQMKHTTATILLSCLTCVALLLVSCTGSSVTSVKTRTGNSALLPPDLTPVTVLKTPTHEPIEIVRDGKSVAVVYVSVLKPEKTLSRLVDELLQTVKDATGAELEQVNTAPPADQPAIIIGDCEESRRAGVDASELPPEGFIVKTAPNRVYLVGSSKGGTAWAVADLLERVVGVRWYWRKEYGGRSVPRRKSLVIPPVHYRDQPVFLNRIHYVDNPYIYPLHAEGHNAGDQMLFPLPAAVDPGRDKPGERASTKLMTPDLSLMRHGTSVDFTPGLIQGRSTMWIKGGSINGDGSTHKQWACYSSQKTLDAYINRVETFWDAGATRSWTHKVITPDSCTLYFPSTPGLVCHCPDCKKTAARFRDDKALRKKLAVKHGDRGAFEILEARANVQVFCLFMKRFCDEVKKRWPDKTVVFRGGTSPRARVSRVPTIYGCMPYGPRSGGHWELRCIHLSGADTRRRSEGGVFRLGSKVPPQARRNWPSHPLTIRTWSRTSTAETGIYSGARDSSSSVRRSMSAAHQPTTCGRA